MARASSWCGGISKLTASAHTHTHTHKTHTQVQMKSTFIKPPGEQQEQESARAPVFGWLSRQNFPALAQNRVLRTHIIRSVLRALVQNKHTRVSPAGVWINWPSLVIYGTVAPPFAFTARSVQFPHNNGSAQPISCTRIRSICHLKFRPRRTPARLHNGWSKPQCSREKQKQRHKIHNTHPSTRMLYSDRRYEWETLVQALTLFSSSFKKMMLFFRVAIPASSSVVPEELFFLKSFRMRAAESKCCLFSRQINNYTVPQLLSEWSCAHVRRHATVIKYLKNSCKVYVVNITTVAIWVLWKKLVFFYGLRIFQLPNMIW